MVSATVDNTPVTVLLGNNETYTPATGSVQKVTVAVGLGERMVVDQGTSSQEIVGSLNGQGERNVEDPELVITDTETIVEEGFNSSRGIYISGFEVN
jgi:hypothetical protein